MFKLIVLGLED